MVWKGGSVWRGKMGGDDNERRVTQKPSRVVDDRASKNFLELSRVRVEGHCLTSFNN